MAPDRTFLLPAVIDDTPQTDERIPQTVTLAYKGKGPHWALSGSSQS
jgi:hypothetical protein